MKPVFAKAVTSEASKVFWLVKIDQPVFYSGFHFHNECQLTYIIESHGRRLIGDNIENYCSGELTLVGANLPHAWHSMESDAVEKEGTVPHASSISIFFDPDRLQDLLPHFIDTGKLSEILSIAKRGMIFYGKTKEELTALLLKFEKATGFAQLTSLMEIFDILSSTSEYELMASEGYVHSYNVKSSGRFDKVVKYIFENFSGDIALDEIAAVGNMNKQAFCRYFKARTQKTFVEFVNAVRIAHACKLLTQGDQSIGSIAYACGFESLSNFNKFFKQAKGVAPRDYKKMIAL